MIIDTIQGAIDCYREMVGPVKEVQLHPLTITDIKKLIDGDGMILVDGVPLVANADIDEGIVEVILVHPL